MMLPEFQQPPVSNPVLLLITPPLMQPNTPYPATPLLTGFLKSRGFSVTQADLGIELLDKIFSTEGLNKIFEAAGQYRGALPASLARIKSLRHRYIDTIGPVMEFLRRPTTDVATRIVRRDWLPEGEHFQTSTDLEWAFGALGITDKAKFLATRYLQDLSDLITHCITPHFSLIRYGEHLSVSLPGFGPMQKALEARASLTDLWMLELLELHIQRERPHLTGFTVPFPGNLYGALRCGQYIREKHPGILTAIGGGYPTTELRNMTDPSLFDYIHLVITDDGFGPLAEAARMLKSEDTRARLFSCAFRQNGTVVYTSPSDDITSPGHAGLPAPDYTGLPLGLYFPLLDTANPMHRLWSDGRWNKLTLAHGCYWHGCAFCDTRLGYIGRYESSTAKVMADTMEAVIRQTGSSAFHFTDEAAPPALLRELCLEIGRRGMKVTWWTNIRFEKSFTTDLCRLMAMAGCIAVTGGIETASDRLLKLMNKGVTIEQAAITCHNFTRAGIMVHAYLMYGFPTQTAQETIDSLEVVRQMFAEGIVRSAFWHRFALTVHSPVSTDPARFGITLSEEKPNPFANNEIGYTEKKSVNHDEFGEGLRTALFNFMQGTGFDLPVNRWFGHKMPGTTHRGDLIRSCCRQTHQPIPSKHSRLIWTGWPVASAQGEGDFETLLVETAKKTIRIKVPALPATKLKELLNKNASALNIYTPEEFTTGLGLTGDEADLIWTERWMNQLRQAGLLVI